MRPGETRCEMKRKVKTIMNFRSRAARALGGAALMVALCISSAHLIAGNSADEAEITRATASLLEHSQFSQNALDDRLSGKFLDLYMDSLDGAHTVFLESDAKEFSAMRSNLARRTVKQGDTRPCHQIFARYLQRLGEEVNYQTNYLRTGNFDFTGRDTWQPDRHEAPFPRDLAAAKALWRGQAREDYLRERLAGIPREKITSTLEHRYERQWQTMQHMSSNDVLEVYLNALAHVYDPHSDYFGKEESENFKIEMSLSLVGIGATLQSKDGVCVISDLVPGGPADKSGEIKPGDRIVAVAQATGDPVDIVDMPLPKAVELVRGAKGSTVRLTIIPSGAGDSARKVVALARDQINLADEHAKAAILDLPQPGGPPMRVGVIELPSFYEKDGDKNSGVSADTARLIKRLKKENARGIILDMRRNGGGSLDEAVRLAGLFIPSGPVVQTRGPDGDADIDVSPSARALYTGPLIVLTSRMSASASEIVAGALQDYGRGIIVGDTSTFGKGTVQTIVPLGHFFHRRGMGEVKVTIRKFYRPSGASTQLKGVASNIILPSTTDLPEISEGKLPNALPWDLMPPTSFTNFDLVRPALADVAEKSRARVAADPAFSLVRQEMEIINKDEGANSLVLNEADRLREKNQIDDLGAKLKKTIEVEFSNAPPSFEVTLATVDAPKLQPASKPRASKSLDKDDGDLELRETENILVDYIRALAARPGGAMVAGAHSQKARAYGD